jgi:rod shape-determining protein MreD
LKRVVALVLLGLLIPMIQGAVAGFLPRGTCPDVGLLLVLALGVSLRSTAAGVALAAWIGFVTDQLSGSLLGQSTLLWLLAFGAARLTSQHVNLRGPLTQMALAGGVTLGSAFGVSALTAFFTPELAPLSTPAELFWQTAVNAIMAPLVLGLAARLFARLGDDDGRRVIRLEPRSYSA